MVAYSTDLCLSFLMECSSIQGAHKMLNKPFYKNKNGFLNVSAYIRSFKRQQLSNGRGVYLFESLVEVDKLVDAVGFCGV